MIFIVSVTGQQVNQPAEASIGEAGSVNMLPASSTAVPESSVSNVNMLSVPKPIRPPRNKSIPACAAKSNTASDELEGLFVC